MKLVWPSRSRHTSCIMLYKIVEMGSNIQDILNVCDEAIENVGSAAEKEFFLNQKSIFHDIYGGDVGTSTSIKDQLLKSCVDKFANACTICNDCNITFSTPANLKRHLLSHEEMHNCSKCKQKYPSLVMFQAHKPHCRFKCSVCAKTYVRRSDFLKHIEKLNHRQDV